MLVTILHLPLTTECQWSFNPACGGSVSCTATNCTAWFVNAVINGQSSLYVPVFNFTIIHAMSHRSDFCIVCSSKVNIWEPACYFTVMYLVTATPVESQRIQIQTMMSVLNLYIPHCKRLWYHPKKDKSLFVIWVTLYWKTNLMLGALLWV